MMFTERYPYNLVNELVSEYSDYVSDLGWDLGTTEVLKYLLRRSGLVATNRFKYDHYSDAYQRYLISPLDYRGLKEGFPYGIKKPLMYTMSESSMIHMLEVPFEDLPLYISSDNRLVIFFTKWRVRHGK